ncbi:MAG: PAS domain-containing protein [Pyrinomonadaceae bacterium]|nr:PAS domain-containing protein [Pyrinomonadaceae bacterium]
MELKLGAKALSPQLTKNESSSELRFVTDLGRNLLSLVHPKKVANCVAESIQREVRAEACAFVFELENLGLVCAAFDSNGEGSPNLVQKRCFKKWLSVLPPQISVWIEDKNEFLLNLPHEFEYISPLHINGKVRGAVIVGFNKKQQFQEKTRRLIDASTQMAALSVNLSAHYEATMDASISSAKEEHRKFTETVVDALPVSLYVIDREYRIVTWNRHREIGEQGLSRDSVIGRNIFDVLTKQPKRQLLAEFEKTFRTGKIERIEQRTTDENGVTKHWLVSKVPMRDHFTGEITHVITVGEDVTMRVEAMQAVAKAEKLAAVGRLAAGVVHEINNPLATISACAEALETRVNEGAFNESPDIADLREYLGLIRNEAFRCKIITNGLLDFSRARGSNRVPLNIADTIRYSARLLTHQKRGERIEINIEEEENLPLVNADEGQMQQAIIALAANGIDAMPEGGTLTFRSYSEKNRVIIEVQDTGIGISPDDMSKIFEPFFTTKEVGKGTGLGLAVCYGIITEHGGRLSVRSNVGLGTTFTITLPPLK